MAITQNFTTPVTGATPPTAATKSPTYPSPPSSVAFNIVRVQLTGDGTLTTATINHNLGLSAAEISAGFPKVHVELNNAAGSPVVIGTKSANQLVVTFAATATQFATIDIERPHATTR